MQHRDGDDEGEVEPVRHIDVRLSALDDRAKKGEQVADPHQRQPDVGIPFRLGIFLGLGYAQQVAGACQHDEGVVAPEDEPGQRATPQPCPAGALHDIERRGDQHIAAEGEDHRGGVQWPQAPEIRPRHVREIEPMREGKLQRQDQSDRHAGHGPEHGGDDARLDHVVGVRSPLVRRGASGVAPQIPDADAHHAGGEGPALDGHCRIGRTCRFQDAGKPAQPQDQRQHEQVDAPGCAGLRRRSLHGAPPSGRSANQWS